MNRGNNRPVVRFLHHSGTDTTEAIIGPELFTLALGGVTVAQRSQLPLDLAWGISVHKVRTNMIHSATAILPYCLIAVLTMAS